MLTLVHPFATSWPSSPKGDARTLRDLLSVSYGMISILVISRCAAPPYPAAPDFLHGKACHTILRSLCSLTNRVPLPPHPGDRINRSMLSCRDMAPWLSVHSPTTKWEEGGGTSHQRGNVFPRPSGRLYGFIQTGAFYDLEAPYNNPRAKGASNLSPLRTFGPSGRQPSRPTGLVHKPPAHYFINSPICLLISPAIICLAFQSPWMPSMASSPGMTG